MKSIMIAIGGYDPVAHHLSGTPQKGLSSITYSWKNAEWRISSIEKYALSCKGHCAKDASWRL